MHSITDWVHTQTREWTSEEKLFFLNQLNLGYCHVLTNPIQLKEPEGKSSPVHLLESITSKDLIPFIYESDSQVIITLLRPSIIKYKIIVDKEPEYIPNEEPSIIECVEPKEQDDLEIIKVGDYFIIKDTNVVIDIEQYVILGYLSNQLLQREQNEEVCAISKQYDIPFSQK